MKVYQDHYIFAQFKVNVRWGSLPVLKRAMLLPEARF